MKGKFAALFGRILENCLLFQTLKTLLKHQLSNRVFERDPLLTQSFKTQDNLRLCLAKF
jgi:hypothetical protein